MAVKAILFDLYNTLVRNEARQWVQTFEEICRLQGIPLDPAQMWARWQAVEVEERRRRVNLAQPDASPPYKTYRVTWTLCFERVFAEVGVQGNPAEAADLCIRAMGCREAFPEAMPLLQSLRGRVRLGILSNADVDFFYPLLARQVFPVDIALCSEEARAYKPHPRPFQVALAWLGLTPREVLFVGDSLEEDIQGAKRVGLRTLWLNWAKAEVPQGLLPPDAQAYSLADVAAYCALEVLCRL
ncbi:MAG: HAD family hydrolase [Dehalococcoidia bacterium]|nr:HAD family hydrolase [Dehalococcoidia bacterium]MDW8120583.1 HAD family hydrolase [Chloroflexota bacterium]